ncbi:MAG: cytochrome C [Acidiphilium sp. 21-66-27]|nr:MAG: cytochrome C [Acidiphilium sp. 20-67-58]OYV64551.1 MAG: cytochrome C [Acidiphilium sp. 21-66-27]
MMKRFIVGAIFASLLAGTGLAHASAVTTGKTLYMAHCSGCHRANGAGGVHFGKAVSANLRAPGLENTYHHSTKLLVRAILDARDEDGDRLDQPMPAWKGRLSKAQALDIIAYLKTLHA